MTLYFLYQLIRFILIFCICIETVPVPKDLAEANEILPQVIKSGMLTDDTLLMLKNAISQVNEWQLLYMESWVYLGVICLFSIIWTMHNKY